MRRKWLAALGISLGSIVVPIDFSIVFTALPIIQKSLDTSFSEMQWVMNIYGLLISIFVVSMGRAADLFGRRKVYLIGVALFGLFSLLAGLSPNAWTLIAARGFQGIAAAIILPVSQALMVHAFPKDEHGKAIGIWASVVGIGLALGPFLSGLLISLFEWRAIFFFNVPFSVLSLIIMSFSIEESYDTKTAPKIDWKGLGLFALCVYFLTVAIMQGPTWGWKSWTTLLFFLIAILSFVFFVYVEKHSKYPIINFSLFQKPIFFLMSLSNSIVIFIVWASLFLIPLFLHNVKDYSPFFVGLAMLAITVPFSALSPYFGNLLKKMPAKWMVGLGIFVLIIFALLEIFATRSAPLLLMMVSFLLFGIGWAMVMGPSTSAGLSSLPREMAALASGAWTTVQEISGSLGLAIVGTLVREHDNFMIGYQNAFILMSILLAAILLIFLFSKK